MNVHRCARGIATTLLTAALAAAVSAQEAHPPVEALRGAFPTKSYSPHAGRNFPTRPYFGDTHVHTGASMDAGAFGARLTPEDAYRFAAGAEVTAANGMRVKLARPLDFIVVADHSDNMGFFPNLFAGNPLVPRRPNRQTLVRRHPKGWGRRGRRRRSKSSISSRRTSFRRRWHRYRGPRTIARRGKSASRPRKRPTIPVPSRLSSASSGRRTPAATICTASSCCVTAATKPGWSSRIRPCRRPAATTRRTCGRICRATRSERAAARSRSRTTATCRTASCSPRSTRSRAGPSRVSTWKHARVGSHSTRLRRSRATANRTRSFRRTTSSPATSSGTKPT